MISRLQPKGITTYKVLPKRLVVGFVVEDVNPLKAPSDSISDEACSTFIQPSLLVVNKFYMGIA